MYDDSNLGVSEFYFFISHLLRFASDWIRESTHDLRQLVQALEERHFTAATDMNSNRVSCLFLPDSPEARHATIEIFRQNWEIVLSHQQKLADGLLDRVAKKQEEVKSLRDGVSYRMAVPDSGYIT